jgi:hypothetical protein
MLIQPVVPIYINLERDKMVFTALILMAWDRFESDVI